MPAAGIAGTMMIAAERVALAERGERRFAAVLLSPAVVVLAGTTTLPLAYLVWQSLRDVNLSMPGSDSFIGAENYGRMWDDGRFWDALQLTVTYTVATVVLQIVIGLGMALMILQVPRAQTALRMAALLPIVLAPVVVGMFWRTLILAPDFGILDFLFHSIGLGSRDWLGDPGLAVVSTIIIHTWQWTPFVFLYLMAAIATIPADLYEAAKIDRAGAWKRFVHITLPMLRPALVMVVILRMTVALSAFAAIYAATGGGPGTATEIVNLFAYRVTFAELDVSYGAAAAVVLLVLTMGISAGLFSLRRGK